MKKFRDQTSFIVCQFIDGLFFPFLALSFYVAPIKRIDFTKSHSFRDLAQTDMNMQKFKVICLIAREISRDLF